MWIRILSSLFLLLTISKFEQAEGKPQIGVGTMVKVMEKTSVEESLTEYSEQTCPQTLFKFPRKNQTTDYLRVKSAIPAMTEVTVCSWYTTNDKGYMDGLFMSYATVNNNNELLIDNSIHGNNILHVYYNGQNDQHKTQYIGINQEFHFCLVLSAAERQANAYVNGELDYIFHFPDLVEIGGGGCLILGQEQDSVGGSFDQRDVYKGEVRNFMLWDRLLTEVEISNMAASKSYCPSDYVVALTDDVVQIYGAVTAQPIP